MRHHALATLLLASSILTGEACVGDAPEVGMNAGDAGGPSPDDAAARGATADAPADTYATPVDASDDGSRDDAGSDGGSAVDAPDGSSVADGSADATGDADAADSEAEIPQAHLVGWWNADETNVTKDTNGLVSTWTDKSPAHNDAKQITGVLQPTWMPNVVGGKAVVHFDGGHFVVTNAVSLGRFTACVTFNATSKGFLVAQNSNPTQLEGFYLYTGNNATILVRRSNNASAWDSPATWGNDGVWKVACMTYDGTHAGTLLYLDGTLQGMSTNQGADPGSAIASQAIYIGAGWNGGTVTIDPVVGSIREIVLYDTAQPAGMIQSLTTAMRAQAGL